MIAFFDILLAFCTATVTFASTLNLILVAETTDESGHLTTRETPAGTRITDLFVPIFGPTIKVL